MLWKKDKARVKAFNYTWGITGPAEEAAVEAVFSGVWEEPKSEGESSSFDSSSKWLTFSPNSEEEYFLNRVVTRELLGLLGGVTESLDTLEFFGSGGVVASFLLFLPFFFLIFG